MILRISLSSRARLALLVCALGLASGPAAASENETKDKLAKLLREKEAKIADLEKRLAAERDRAVAAQIEAVALKNRNAALLAQVEELTRALAKLKGGAGGVPPADKGIGRNPPTVEVEGLIKTVDAATGLITLTVGRDAGLEKGHTLEVFRLDPPKYLGTVRLVEVSATEAVAQSVGKPGALKPGDHVSSKLLPK